MRRLTTLAILMALTGAPAHANDSSASMAAGGLELIKSDQIRMVSEVLRIAPRLVEVDYIFENTSGADITTEVAFPLPELSQPHLYNSPLNIPFREAQNFVGFQVWIDGKEIKPNIEVRAFAKEEITAELKRLNIDPVNPNIGDAKKPLSSEAKETLLRLEALEDEVSNPYAGWSTKVNLHWSQVFPAGKQIAVRHRYRPTFGSWYDPPESSGTNTRELGGQWCFDQSFGVAERRLLDRQKQAFGKNGGRDAEKFTTHYDHIQYVLKTGANWKGPIGRFELQIEKGGASLISTCPIPGLQLQRTSYGFNAVAKNYTPTVDLDILFVSDKWLGKPDGSGPAR